MSRVGDLKRWAGRLRVELHAIYLAYRDRARRTSGGSSPVNRVAAVVVVV